jgi:hypothetical protein
MADGIWQLGGLQLRRPPMQWPKIAGNLRKTVGTTPYVPIAFVHHEDTEERFSSGWKKYAYEMESKVNTPSLLHNELYVVEYQFDILSVF